MSTQFHPLLPHHYRPRIYLPRNRGVILIVGRPLEYLERRAICHGFRLVFYGLRLIGHLPKVDLIHEEPVLS